MRLHRLVALEERARDLNKYKDIYSRIHHPTRDSVLLQEMKRAFLSGGVNVIAITGRKGVGKSAFSLLLLKKLLGVEDPNIILDHVFFAPSVLYRTLLKYDLSGVRIPALVIDDAGVWLSGHFYSIDRYEYAAMRSLLQLIRPFTANLILTLPTMKELSKNARAELTHILHMKILTPYIFVAKLYKVNLTPLAYLIKLYAQISVHYSKLFSEVGEIYREYEKYRNKYISIYYSIIQKKMGGKRGEVAEEEGEGEGGEVYEDINDIDVEVVEG